MGDSIAIVVGKHGLGWGAGVATGDTGRGASDPVKKEGDGKSPAGVFQLGTAFGYAPEALSGSKLHYLELTPSIECVDDVNSKFYNRVVDRSKVAADWKSSEHMRETGEAYRLGIVVDHNGIAGASSEAPVRGGGSCIFLHIWQGAGHGTAGCTAMAPAEIEVLLRWLDPKRKPLLVQLTAEEFARVMKPWGLPTVVNMPGSRPGTDMKRRGVILRFAQDDTICGVVRALRECPTHAMKLHVWGTRLRWLYEAMGYGNKVGERRKAIRYNRPHAWEDDEFALGHWGGGEGGVSGGCSDACGGRDGGCPDCCSNGSSSAGSCGDADAAAVGNARGVRGAARSAA